MHDDASNAIKLEQLATMTDRLLLRAGRTQPPVALAPELTGDRFSVPSLAKPGRHARVSPRLSTGRAPSRSVAGSTVRAPSRSAEGSTVHGYAPAPRSPEPVAPVAFAKGSLSPELAAHEAFPPEPVAQSLSYERAPRAAVARGSAPQLGPSVAPAAHASQAAAHVAPAAHAAVSYAVAPAAHVAPAPVSHPAAPGSAAPASVSHAASVSPARVWRVPVHAADPGPEAERTLFVRPLPPPVPLSLTTRAVQALRSPSFAAKVIIPALVGAVLGLIAIL